MTGERWRPAWAEIDLDAVRHNASLLCRLAAPSGLCAVVKADAYGHGELPVARAALEGGASWLAVALVEEGVTLRQAGVEAPILLLSEPPEEAMAEAVARRLVPTVYTAACIRALAKAVADGGFAPVPVHLKVDTGMHRVGADPADAVALADLVRSGSSLGLGAVWTHLAVAEGGDPVDTEFTRLQLERFDAVLSDLAAAGHHPPLTHVANSAGAISTPPGPSGSRSLRHRRLRRRARPRRWPGCCPRPPGAGPCARCSRCGAGSPSSATSMPANASPTAAAVPCRNGRRWPWCRSVTPTACRGACSTTAARS